MGVPSCSPYSMLIYSDANADYYGTVNRIGYHDNSGGNSGSWYKTTNDASNPFETAEPKPRVHDTGYQSLGMGTTAIAKVNDGFLFIYNDLLCHAIVSSTQSVASTLVLDDVEVYPFYKKFGKNTRLLGSRYDSVNNDLYLIVTGQNNTSYFYQKYGVIKFTNLSKTPTNAVSRQSLMFVLGGVYGAYYHPITGIRNDLKDIVLTDYDWDDSSAPFDTKDLNLVDDVKYYNNG